MNASVFLIKSALLAVKEAGQFSLKTVSPVRARIQASNEHLFQQYVDHSNSPGLKTRPVIAPPQHAGAPAQNVSVPQSATPSLPQKAVSRIPAKNNAPADPAWSMAAGGLGLLGGGALAGGMLSGQNTPQLEEA